jgi:hypothetical protein
VNETLFAACYLRLARAADAIGAANHERWLARRGRRRKADRFPISPAHRDVVAAMEDLGRGRINSEDVWQLLHRSDVEAEQRKEITTP